MLRYHPREWWLYATNGKVRAQLWEGSNERIWDIRADRRRVLADLRA